MIIDIQKLRVLVDGIWQDSLLEYEAQKHLEKIIKIIEKKIDVGGRRENSFDLYWHEDKLYLDE